MQTERCTVPKPEWMEVKIQREQKMVQEEGKEKKEREREGGRELFHTHAAEIQLPFRLHH